MSDKVGEDELHRRMAGCPRVGSFWRHYKTGNVYAVVGCAIAESTLEPLVLYRHLRITFARPLSEFLGEVSPGTPRFTVLP